MSTDAMPDLQKWERRTLADAPVSGLENGELHYWLFPLVQSGSAISDLQSSLSVDELERASRFHFERHRREFIAARGLLRRLIGHYLGTPAASIRFEANAYGKPRIAAATGGAGLDFNLSHSGDWAFAGFAREAALGVDIEQVRDMPDMMSVAEDTFSRGETALLQALPSERRSDGFFTCWTRKEAYVKAVGLGLSLDLKSFDVSLAPAAQADNIRNLETGAAYRIEGLRPVPGYWAATAVEMSEINGDGDTRRLSKFFALAT